ncbi:MAG: XRE family transcriptional regulator, partial [Bacteroidetes bacterium HGW-Bacteroidetes-23]
MIQIGSKIRKKRIEKGFSQEYLADLLHLSQGTLSNIESGKSVPDVLQLQQIASALDTTISDLVDSSKVIFNNVETNHGIGYAEIVNQLSDKLVEQYEKRIAEKDFLI